MINDRIISREQGTLSNVSIEPRVDSQLGAFLTDQQRLLDQGVPIMPTATQLSDGSPQRGFWERNDDPNVQWDGRDWSQQREKK